MKSSVQTPINAQPRLGQSAKAYGTVVHMLDLSASQVLRTNELQVWFLSEHLVNMPLVEAEERDA